MSTKITCFQCPSVQFIDCIWQQRAAKTESLMQKYVEHSHSDQIRVMEKTFRKQCVYVCVFELPA